LGIAAEGPVVLFVSGYLDDPIKGYPFFEEALCRLASDPELRNLQVLLVGRGQGGERLKERYKVVEFGYVEDMSRMALIYAAADLYVMPSILDNLPSVILESMACGTPVVGFDTGGIPEMIAHGVNGLIAGNRDVSQLADHMGAILKNSEMRKRMSEQALETARTCHHPRLQVERYLSLYHELINRQS
jgi:glycosyltransferase involved in cell wall biosynthesis